MFNYSQALTETKCLAFDLKDIAEKVSPDEKDRAWAMSELFRILYFLLPGNSEDEKVQAACEFVWNLSTLLARISRSDKVYLDKAYLDDLDKIGVLTHFGFKFGISDLEEEG